METDAQGAIAVRLDSRMGDAAQAARDAARRGEGHRRTVAWAAGQLAVAAAWRLVTRARPRGNSLRIGGAALEQP